MGRNSKYGLTGLFTIRDAIEVGYPFVESLLSIYPFVDEFLINDGGSTDGTLQVLQRLQSIFPKIRLYQIPDYPSKIWECVDSSLLTMIKDASNDWLFEIQADESIHEKDYDQFHSELRIAHESGCNGIRHRRLDHSGTNHQANGYDYRVVRVLRNVEGLRSLYGGDDWYVPSAVYVRTGFGSSNMEPEYDSDVCLYHFNSLFYEDKILRANRHVNYLAIGHTPRVNYLKNLQKGYQMNEGQFLLNIEARSTNNNLPYLMRTIPLGLTYTIREELFDPEWLEEVTGLPFISF